MRRRQCKVTLGTTYVINGRSGFRCELPRGHDGPHERWSPPLEATWEEDGKGGRRVYFGHADAGQ